MPFASALFLCGDFSCEGCLSEAVGLTGGESDGGAGEDFVGAEEGEKGYAEVFVGGSGEASEVGGGG